MNLPMTGCVVMARDVYTFAVHEFVSTDDRVISWDIACGLCLNDINYIP